MERSRKMTTQRNINVKKHANRPDLTGEHSLGDLGQLILMIIFLGVWLTDIFFIKFKESDYINLSHWLSVPIGILVLFSGFYFARNSMKMIFGTKRDKPEMINDKIYEKVRHPMYLGSLLFYLGITILMCSLPLLLMFMIIFLFYNFIARHEEKLLLNQFGEEYALYMKNVRRWIPKL